MDNSRHSTRSAGGIVLGDAGTLVLVNKVGNARRGFPKGHIEEGETDEAAAVREIAEETGLTNLEYIDDLGGYERYKMNPDGSEDTSEHKTIHLFLFAAEPHAVLSPTDASQEAEWISLKHVAEELANDKERAWLTTVFERVRQAIQRD